MKHLRQYIRIILEASEFDTKLKRLFDAGEFGMALSVAASMGIPLEELPWDAPDNVRQKGADAIIKHLMDKDTGDGSVFHFEQAFAIAEEVGIKTQDLPWDHESVGAYLDPVVRQIGNDQFDAMLARKTGKGKPGRMYSGAQVDKMYDERLAPTGWTVEELDAAAHDHSKEAQGYLKTGEVPQRWKDKYPDWEKRFPPR